MEDLVIEMEEHSRLSSDAPPYYRQFGKFPLYAKRNTLIGSFQWMWKTDQS